MRYIYGLITGFVLGIVITRYGLINAINLILETIDHVQQTFN